MAIVSRYGFSEYSAAWPAEFALEAERLRELLGEVLVAVHHVGSTSVPGLAAKPVVDVLPLVSDLGRVDGRIPAMEAAGYRSWGEYGLAGRRFFTRDRDGWRTHNVHVYAAGDPAVVRHLAFPAYLRAHPALRDEYAELKRRVFAAHPADIEAYCDGKDAWIKRVEAEALSWWRTQQS